jgi:Acetyltransferase (GNAT) family
MKTLEPLFQLSKLPPEFEAIFVDPQTYREETMKRFEEVFPTGGRAPHHAVSDERMEKARTLSRSFTSQPLTLRILVRRKSNSELVGWVSGEQHDWETFYLRNSGFIPAVRRQGLYRSIHEDVVRYLDGLGFERIVSDHSPNNKAILMMKIGFGYFVNAVTIDDRFGPMVRLLYIVNADRRKRYFEKYDLIDYDVFN